MSSLFSLLPLLLVPFFYAALLKLGAFLLRRLQVRWKHAVVFGFLALAVSVAGTLANRAVGTALPPLAVGLAGIALQLGLGGWFFGPRAKKASGGPIGFGGGVLLCLVTLVMVFLVGLGAAMLMPSLQSAAPA